MALVFKNLPQIMQRFMRIILKILRENSVEIYMDVILIQRRTREKYDEKSREFMRKLEDNNMGRNKKMMFA